MKLRTIIRAIALSLLMSMMAFGAHAQSLQAIPFHYLSTASNNSTPVAGAGQNLLNWLFVTNTTTTTYYMKLYNKATAPTCGTDTPVMNIPLLPTSATANGQIAMGFDNTKFSLGIGFCITGALADNDNSNAATGIAVNIGYVNQ
jgi:hypothetical protein